MTQWPYTQTDHDGWECGICGKEVKTEIMIIDQYGHQVYFPASLYWNVEKSEVYCGPVHSLEGHKKSAG